VASEPEGGALEVAIGEAPQGLTLSAAVPIDPAVAGVDQRTPAAAYDPVTDRYLVVWSDDRSGVWRIWGAFVSAVGTPGPAFPVGMTPGGAGEIEPDVAADGQGGFLVVAADDDGLRVTGALVASTGAVTPLLDPIEIGCRSIITAMFTHT
jgi:hypothetical protein